MNRPRAKGTAAETAVVRWFQAQGERQVERHALHGNRDVGDINGLPSMVVSVKAPGQGRPVNFSAALADLEVMKRNATRYDGEELPCGLLVSRRVGYRDVGDWYAVQRLGDWWALYRELLT